VYIEEAEPDSEGEGAPPPSDFKPEPILEPKVSTLLFFKKKGFLRLFNFFCCRTHMQAAGCHL
jgi:hypothetical protein